MSSARWPGILHVGETSQQLEVSADQHSLILHLPGKPRRWAFREVRYSSGGVPRFERGTELLIVSDKTIIESIEMLNPQAVSGMEHSHGGMFSPQDFLSALMAVLVVMGGALALFAVIWFFRR